MTLTQEHLEKQIVAALNENDVIWAPGQVSVSSSAQAGSHTETSDKIFHGEIFKGALAGFGLQVMNFGSVSAMLQIPEEHLPADHKLSGILMGRGVMMPLNTEIAKLVWNKASSGQSSAS